MNKNELDKFLSYAVVFKQYSDSTVRRYSMQLSDFMRYMSYNHKNRSWYDVNITHITDYLTLLSKKKTNSSSRYFGKNAVITSATVSNYIKSLIGFFKWLHVYGEHDCINHTTIPKVKVYKPKIETLSDDEVEYFLTIPERIEKRKDIALRNKLYFAMLYTTGCRASELLPLMWSDIDRINKEIVVK